MSKLLKVAVIGAGHLGKWHADKYAAATDCELVAVVDSNLENAESIAHQHGVPAYTDYREVIPLVDAISLMVPTSLHYKIAREFLEAGIHCLVKKPLCETVHEANKLIDFAAQRGLVLQTGHIERFNSVMIGLEPDVENPLFLEPTRLAPFTPRATDVNVILDLMIHDIDIKGPGMKSPQASLKYPHRRTIINAASKRRPGKKRFNPGASFRAVGAVCEVELGTE